MNISSKGQYALQAIFDLASQNTDEPVKIATIAERQGIPQKFLELILSSLKQGGFVESQRGAGGGYHLARLPEAITVGEVLRFVDGSPQQKKGPKRETPFSELWRNVDKSVAGIVDGANFASIVRKWAEKQRTYVHDWEI
jgi:Rrf2 family transcriptional regulator, cysteine metabolism repressor